MLSTNNLDINKLGRECQRLEINMNIGRTDGSQLLTNLNVRMLRTNVIQVTLPVVFPTSISVSLDRLSEEETPKLG